MNEEKPDNQESYRSLLLLDELSKGQPVSQRDLSRKLGIALGLVNSYLKNLVAKGYVTISQIPAKRYAYYLTPKGFAEKTRLTYHLLQDYTNIYREARRGYRELFADLEGRGIRTVVFAGADEVAEIAYLSLQEVDIELAGVVDDDRIGTLFFREKVRPVSEFPEIGSGGIVITTYLRREAMFRSLLENGAAGAAVFSIYPMEREGRGGLRQPGLSQRSGR